MSFTLEQITSASPVVPVMVIERLEDAVPLAQALIKGGLLALEITLRTAVALDAIKAIKKALPDAMVGAGTILSPKDLQAATDAGASFIVTPGTSPALLEALANCELPVLPGVSTPSEALALYELGFSTLKFFPAEAAGGAAMLKSIGGPVPQLNFCPTGGINPNNAEQYLALKNVVCVGGSWMVPAALIKDKKWDDIEALARQAASLSRS